MCIHIYNICADDNDGEFWQVEMTGRGFGLYFR